MAIDDNKLYNLKGSQLKELTSKIKATEYKFQDGLKVGLYSCIDKYYDINDGRNDRTYNEFKSYTVYTQIFKI